jgi:hypothetical protein
MNIDATAVPVLSQNEAGFWFADGKAISLVEAIAIAKTGCNFTSGAYEAMKKHLAPAPKQ